MIFRKTEIGGVFVLEPQPHDDERGSFARTYCADEFADNGVRFTTVQCSTSFNRRKGTLRGLHYQAAPAEEPKLVRCTRGSIFDVAVDLRPDSPTRCAWTMAELTADNRRALYVPEGCAHGFLTLEDASEVFYQIGAPHVPEAARGVRWNDPAFGIDWPMEPTILSERDASYPDFENA